jgi:hypothetical protein
MFAFNPQHLQLHHLSSALPNLNHLLHNLRFFNPSLFFIASLPKIHYTKSRATPMR